MSLLNRSDYLLCLGLFSFRTSSQRLCLRDALFPCLRVLYALRPLCSPLVCSPLILPRLYDFPLGQSSVWPAFCIRPTGNIHAGPRPSRGKHFRFNSVPLTFPSFSLPQSSLLLSESKPPLTNPKHLGLGASSKQGVRPIFLSTETCTARDQDREAAE